MNQSTAKSPQWIHQITYGGRTSKPRELIKCPIASGAYAQADYQQPFPADMHANSAEQSARSQLPRVGWRPLRIISRSAINPLPSRPVDGVWCKIVASSEIRFPPEVLAVVLSPASPASPNGRSAGRAVPADKGSPARGWA